jgi:hypothetical protein
MATPRNQGGMGKDSGGSNVNPLYRPVQLFGEYVDRTGKEWYELNRAKKEHGVGSKEWKKQRGQVIGSVFQNRRYTD